MKVTALIVEDEPLARDSLRELVDEIEWIEPLGEVADGAAAIRFIDDKKPDIVFLDVELPELSGTGRFKTQEYVVWATGDSKLS